MLASIVDDERWAADRLADLGTSERELYAGILRSFVAGDVPAAVAPEAREALNVLVGRDLVQLDGDRGVIGAYPFSRDPTRHRVELSDGRGYFAMCAIDALGIPFLTGRDGRIDSQEPDSDNVISVTVRLEEPARSSPVGAVAVVASSGPGCTANCACPHINLFASAAAAERYLSRPELRGELLTIPEATAAGRQLFGNLLERVAT